MRRADSTAKSDSQLMAESAEGDLKAFDQLVCRYQDNAFNIALRMLSDEHLAADAAQEAFLRLLEQCENYKPRPDAKFSTYFYTILRRICIDYYRKKKPKLRADFKSEEKESDNPSELLIKDEFNESVHRAVDTLPPRQKMALILKHFEDKSYKEIARIMECSPAAVDSLLIRARKKLADILENP